MFSQIGKRHAAIQGRQGLYQVIPIQDGVVVGSSKVIQGPDPKVRWKPEIVLFTRNEALDSGVGFRIQDGAQNRLQFRHAASEHLKDPVSIKFAWPRR